jgi:hypothetical protein
MTDIREHPPPATAPAAPAARAMAATGPGRALGLDGIRGLAAPARSGWQFKSMTWHV